MILVKISVLHINSLSRPFHPAYHSLPFFSGSFAVQNGDHFLPGIIFGLGIICGTVWRSFAVVGSFAVLGLYAAPYRLVKIDCDVDSARFFARDNTVRKEAVQKERE